MSGRRGRKRGYGSREPNGRLQRKPAAETIAESVRIARNQPHRRGLKSNDRPSERAESALGRLSLAGAVTGGEFEAGETFAKVVAHYRAVIEGPRTVRSLALGAVADSLSADDGEEVAPRFDCATAHADPIERQLRLGGITTTHREWPCQLTADGCACLARRQRYDGIYEAIARAGRRALLAVIRVVVRGEEVAPQDLVYLKAGLDAARRHLGLTERDGAAHGRNRH